jgi:UDP-N-acetylglucosamine 2-epimerase (non-hydrolysing)
MPSPTIRPLLVFGTRPEALKMAPLVLAMQGASDFEPLVAVTAQHRVMLDQVLELFGIVPDFDLEIIEERQTLTGMTTKALSRLSPLVESLEPDAVIVQGDTTTSFVGALAAFYHRVPVVHLEAGLRTGDVLAPYPEEMNRRLTAQLTELHLAPTAAARQNLLAEGVRPECIVVTGNTVIDALLRVVGLERDYGVAALERLDENDSPVVVVTVHRRESWGASMTGIGLAVADIARARPDLTVVLPVHRNPVVREALLPAVDGLPNVVVTEPMAYGGFARLMQRSTLILTDSGGIQEEAPSLGKPVLVVRETTERPEGLVAGTARLVGTSRDRIRDGVLALLEDAVAYAEMAKAVNPYGDGQAARRCLDAIRYRFGGAERPGDFVASGSGIEERADASLSRPA